jgi:hypothetical protein
MMVKALSVPPGLFSRCVNHSLNLLIGFQLLETFACVFNTSPCLNSNKRKGPSKPKEKTLNKADKILNAKYVATRPGYFYVPKNCF